MTPDSGSTDAVTGHAENGADDASAAVASVGEAGARIFLAALSAPLAGTVARVPPVELIRELDAVLTRARQGRGMNGLPVQALLAHLARAASESGEAGWPLHALCVEELSLALGCTLGLAPALEVFHADYLPTISGALTRLGLTPDTKDEAQSAILEAVLVGATTGAGPLIARYAGRGPLRGWLRVVAARISGRHVGRMKRELPMQDDVLDHLLAPIHSPELSGLRQRFRDAFKRAFAAAVDSLNVEDRVLLHSYYMDQLTVDQLADVYGIHRGTVSRRLARIRQELHQQTTAGLQRALGLAEAELGSIMELMQNQLDITIPSLLAK